MDERSPQLPSDPYELALSRLIGLPNGAHTQPAVTQTIDFYGNVSNWMTQTVKTDEGDFVFLTLVQTGSKADRFVVPPKVLAMIDRQRSSTLTMVRRRHGRRLAAERKQRGELPAFLSNPPARRRAKRAKK